MNTSKFLRVTLSALVGVMALAACNVNLKDKNGVPIGATRIQIVANTGAMPWLEQAAEELNDGRVKTPTSRSTQISSAWRPARR